jgi:hypothetical protein
MEITTHFDEGQWEPFSHSIVRDANKFLESGKIRQDIQTLLEKLNQIIKRETGAPPASWVLVSALPRVSQEEHEKAAKDGLPCLNLEIRVTCREWLKLFPYKMPPRAIREMDVGGDPIVYLPETPWTTWILEGDTHGISREEIMGKYVRKSEAVSMIRDYLDRIGFLKARVEPEQSARPAQTGPQI